MSLSFLPRPRWLLALLLLLVVAIFAKSWHLDDRAWFWLKESGVAQAERDASIWLPNYQAVIQAKPLAGLDDDEPSDLTYNPQTRTLFTVTGMDPQLVELSLDGEVLRNIPLHGFSNPEGVAVMADGNMAITDERRRTLSLFKLSPLTLELNAPDTREFDLGPSASGNKGFEGIAWDPAQQRLLLGNERSPLALYSWHSDGSAELAGTMQALPSDQLYMRNLSALSVDPRTGHTLVLSAQSNLLLEIDEQGEPVSFISLIGGLNGLDAKIPRAEGVAIDEQGTIYMVSEPNLFYVFRPETPETPETPALERIQPGLSGN
ncbi:SdiA-regulated domain-containing protein [Pseudomonas sp. UL073]|uniref:SdiA-regulated domain-containing protein n=1 Tax=Zestomonas insulae TaxID=2809017 RepID=A0ABS2IH99_9GAMM|nr:SdiA-regulated domain-containing protein [Pseudomonas insulae]MBM7062442.1 SdiA-regulated domain-containing protein [Pseudomonas insulae]